MLSCTVTRAWYICLLSLFFYFANMQPFCRCPNLAVKEAEDDENVEEEDVPVEKAKKVSQAKRKKQTQCSLTWIGEPVQVLVSLILGCCSKNIPVFHEKPTVCVYTRQVMELVVRFVSQFKSRFRYGGGV